MDWKAFFTGVEANWLSVWVRESASLLAFPTIIALHAIGMGFLVGANVAMDLRVLGFAPRIPLPAMAILVPNMVFGFCLNAASGLLLLLAYPTKALTNPLFYAKLILIALAVIVAWVIRKRVLGEGKLGEAAVTTRDKMLAGASLAMWAAAIFAGRFLAYTYNYLTAYDL
jgi:hypothetical protein